MKQQQKKYDYTAAILAGGKNTRFSGRTKAKIPVEGRPIIEMTLEILEAVFTDIVIITNNESEFSAYKHIRMAGDIYHNRGPLGGLHSALSNTDRDAVFLVASDMPGLSVTIVSLVARAYEEGDCDVLMPVHKGLIEPLHAVYSKTVLGRLENFIRSGNKYSIREFLKFVDVRYLVIEDESSERDPFFNINSPEDLQKWY